LWWYKIGYAQRESICGLCFALGIVSEAHSHNIDIANSGTSYCTLKQKGFYLKTYTKPLKIKEINQENPENHFNLGIV
jgi:hypothetical protein